MAFPRVVNIDYGKEKVVSTSKNRTLGTKGMTPDGRVFFWALNGAAQLEPNRVVQAKAQEGGGQHAVALKPSTADGDWDATAPSPGIQVGQTEIGVVWVTNHSSGEYTDGWMTVETTPSSGTFRIITDADKGDSSTVTVIRLHPDDGIVSQVLTTVSRLGFAANEFSSVIVAPAVLTNIVVGISPVTVPATTATVKQYFWCQTSGMCAVRYNDLIAAVAGNKVIAGLGATAGDLTGHAGTTVTTTAAIGDTLSVQNAAQRQVLGYAMSIIPDDGDLLQIMLTLRS